MKQVSTKGIVLARTDYGEADRIIKFLTPDNGKISVIAKGVRKNKSKLAGSIELFSVSELTYIVGKSEIYTLISARLINHYGNIVKEIERTNCAYNFIKTIDKATAEHPEKDYFNLLSLAFEALDDLSLDPGITAIWFNMQLLKLGGHSPNLQTDTAGEKLDVSNIYNFELDSMCFSPDKSEHGIFNANHIKFLRLGFNASNPQTLHRVDKAKELTNNTQAIVMTMLKNHVRV